MAAKRVPTSVPKKISALTITEPATFRSLDELRSQYYIAMQVTDRLEVRLSGLNLLDLHYRTFGSGISAPGRNLRATLSARF